MTPKQKRFVEEYLVDLNGTQAAIRAGYTSKRADQMAYALLRMPEIVAALAAAQAARSARTEVTADQVLREIARVAFSDCRRLFDERGNLRPVGSLEPDMTAALASFEAITRSVVGGEKGDSERVQKVKLWDKVRALELLAKHLGMLKERAEGPAPGPLFILPPGTNIEVDLPQDQAQRAETRPDD